MTLMTKLTAVEASRRGVLKGLGAAGFLLSAPIVSKGFRAEATGRAGQLENSVYLAIDGDGTVHITIHRVEMGQGSRTGLPMIIADELDADWSRCAFHQALGDAKYGDQNTDGSTSIRKFYDIFREAGATARLMLERAAAAKWGVDPASVKADNHRIVHPASGRAADFGELVALAVDQPVPEKDALTFKSKDQWRYVGKPVPILDMKGIITGTAVFGQDIRRDGMLYAVAVRPPVVGGRITGYDADAAKAVNGVVDVVELPALSLPAAFKPLGGVAVLATNTWAAMKGRDALAATFEDGPNAAYDTAAYEKQLWASIDGDGKSHLNRGNVDEAEAGADTVLTGDYFVPHLVHAPMEPPAATADWADDGTVDIWTHAQDPQTVQQTVAALTGIEPGQVRAHSALLGGAFGRKSKPDFAAEAAILAKAAGRPVKMVWTREDDIRHGFYHTIAAQRVTVAMDTDKRVTGWRHKAAYPSIGATFQNGADAPGDFELSLGLLDMPFDVPSVRVETGKAPAHVRIGWLRSVANIQQAFAVGSMVDEVAHARGQSTVDTWLDLIGSDRRFDPSDDGGTYSNYGETLERHPLDTGRLKAVLKKVADMSGFGRDPGPGRGIGIAVHRSFVSYVACALEVAVDEGGLLRVPRAWMAIDCGLAVNPDRVKAQMEGAVIFGLSIARHGQITAEKGRIVQGNYDGYPVCRIDETPVTEVAIMDVDAVPGGVGEPGVPPVAPALANAIFAATGKRLRRLPIADQLIA
ncbi:xanthine dehydrogenase family protein molybdopterin-binding subunit [Eilatimonas milleporae]|uniref:Isoquinoline 1-oxidoreductase beta subunit n=1 Tax=Eilatimonas milleporae TaxID=911205 RepID=A0A3M0CTC7_9PROT|nr:molybdopterin cofactor-binding domain-containing protein [Eilatimonas milleporae]RMB12195.1 isoquinoline 1-oxidoreductase beta subunit [Eilatimonas milleporae]